MSVLVRLAALSALVHVRTQLPPGEPFVIMGVGASAVGLGICGLVIEVEEVDVPDAQVLAAAPDGGTAKTK